MIDRCLASTGSCRHDHLNGPYLPEEAWIWRLNHHRKVEGLIVRSLAGVWDRVENSQNDDVDFKVPNRSIFTPAGFRPALLGSSGWTGLGLCIGSRRRHIVDLEMMEFAVGLEGIFFSRLSPETYGLLPDGRR